MTDEKTLGVRRDDVDTRTQGREDQPEVPWLTRWVTFDRLGSDGGV